jgi:hypothetical protein
LDDFKILNEFKIEHFKIWRQKILNKFWKHKKTCKMLVFKNKTINKIRKQNKKTKKKRLPDGRGPVNSRRVERVSDTPYLPTLSAYSSSRSDEVTRIEETSSSSAGIVFQLAQDDTAEQENFLYYFYCAIHQPYRGVPRTTHVRAVQPSSAIDLF